MRYSHLLAALCALMLVSVGIIGGWLYADRLETEYAHAFGGIPSFHKRQGFALQRVALAQPDLLPIYGSSELLIPDPFRADKIFRWYPTGFNVFMVGGNGVAPLLQAQMLAGLGSALRGKRVVISLSPQFFIEPEIATNAYCGNFSRLHAYAFAMSALPVELKQRIAKRMLKYPAAWKADPLLQFLIKGLAARTFWSPLRDAAIYPLAKLQLAALELQDHWETVELIQAHAEINPDITRRAQALNWQMLQAHAAQYAQAHATNNPFAIDNGDWDEKWQDLIDNQTRAMSDAEFKRALNVSQGWQDLELLLDTLRANGAAPLLTTMPWHGAYWDYRGVSVGARQEYYARLEKLAQQYNVPVVTFETFENQKYFLRNPGAHLSAVGWVEYSRVLDGFFHEKPLATAP